MFLDQLRVYAHTIAERLPPPMYQLTSIRYIIVLSQEGRLLGVDETVGVGKEKKGQFHQAPHCKRAAGIRPKLLVDNGEYTLGLAREESNPKRVQEQHYAYVRLIEDCARETGHPAIQAILQFLNTLDLSEIGWLKPVKDPAANISFRVEGCTEEGRRYPFEFPIIQLYWAKKAAAADETHEAMQCLVCGEMQPPVERLPIVIKGIPGGQSTGLTLISANAAAFESYGQTASLVAPTCERCGESFGNALNDLLREERTHLVIPPLAYIFWTRVGIDPQVRKLLQANPVEVKNLLIAAMKAKTDSIYTDPTAFYAATLSASGARVVIRDWIETTMGTFHQNIIRYFRLQGLQSVTGEIEYFPLWQLVNATVNVDAQEKPLARVGQELLSVALRGGALPHFLLHAVIRRVRAKRQVQPAQAALIKLVLLSQCNHTDFPLSSEEGGDDMIMIEDSRKHQAYVCGRLFALLDYIQYKALGRVNASISDRFYGSASSAPAVVFPRLLRMAQPHLTAIRQIKDTSPRQYLGYLEKELSLLASELPEFPKTLLLEEQGWFALGFHRQRVKNFSQRSDAVSDTDAQQATEGDTSKEDDPQKA